MLVSECSSVKVHTDYCSQVSYCGTLTLALQTKAKVEEIKYSGTGSLGSRRIVDEFESHLSEANAKCERNQQKYARNTVPKDDSKWPANPAVI